MRKVLIMIKRLWIPTIAALVLGRAAGATTIDTPPIVFTDTFSTTRCIVVNNSDKPITLTGLSFYKQDGSIIGPFAVGGTIDPHKTLTFAVSDGSLDQGFCRVQGAFSKKAVKVTLCAGDTIGGCARAVSN